MEGGAVTVPSTLARRCSLLLLALLMTSTRAAELQYARLPRDDRLTISPSLSGVSRAVSEQDLAELIKDNLEPDIRVWRERGSDSSAPLSAKHLLDFLHQIDTQWPEYRRNFIAIIMIRSQRIRWWAYPTARKWCIDRVEVICRELEKYSSRGLYSLPDTMFVMNGYDKPLCAAGNCSAPIFSFDKSWGPAPTSSASSAGTTELISYSTTASPSAAASSSSPSAAASSLNSAARPTAGEATYASGPVSTTANAGEPFQASSNLAVPSVQPAVQSAVHPASTATNVARTSATSVAETTMGASFTAAEGSHTAAAAGSPTIAHSSTAADASPHDDILFPVLNHPFESLINYPWEAKIADKAFMRAGIYAAMAADCQRVKLYKLSCTEQGKEALDVGIYQNRHWKVKVKTVAPVPMEQHARWRFLLSTDGQAASWRLAKLLSINSVILKYRSNAIEYYYRSLKENVHYLSVDDSDVLDVVQSLGGGPGGNSSSSELTQRLQQVTVNAQAFAYRYLSQQSRSAYAAAALNQYTALYSDMDELLATITIYESQGIRLSMPMLMSLREKYNQIKLTVADQGQYH